jgi:hypothetical protein
MSNWLLLRRIDRRSAQRTGVDGPDSRLRDDAVASIPDGALVVDDNRRESSIANRPENF